MNKNIDQVSVTKVVLCSGETFYISYLSSVVVIFRKFCCDVVFVQK